MLTLRKIKPNPKSKHTSEIMLYESARKELKELCENEKIPSLKQLRAEKEELTLRKNQQYEDYSFSRAKFRELQTVRTNVNSILNKEQKLEKAEPEL